MKPQINKIIVVEGRNDESAVKAAVDAEIIITGGFSISTETWHLIEKAYNGPGLIIFTDPDYAGENIRKRIMQRFPESSNAYLPREAATKNKDVGIENASVDNIIEALNNSKAIALTGVRESCFTIEDLLWFSLIGVSGSAERRYRMGKVLGIGNCNGKTFLARLNGYGISREEFYLHGQALFSGDDAKNNKKS